MSEPAVTGARPAPAHAAAESRAPVAAAGPAPAAQPKPDPAADASAHAPSRTGWRDLWIYALVAALVLACWGVTRLRLYDTKSDLAYWMGVAGGSFMLLLLSYPMRKHLRFMHGWGRAKIWFVVHMVLGISGPLLILLHSNFEIGSLNAGVAFYSMVLVAVSGVVGRFLYLHVHRNLSGERESLAQLKATLDADNTAASRLDLVPNVFDRCRQFELYALERRKLGAAGILHVMIVVRVRRWQTSLACRAELRRRLVMAAHANGWSRRRMNQRLKGARKIIDNYLLTAQRVAMFGAWEKLFRLWHVIHIPFVYILVLSAIAHVVAVHVY